MNEAYKRVRANKGTSGIDEMTIEETLSYLIREYKDELMGKIKSGKYTLSPVRRIEIPKADGVIRKLSIPTVIARSQIYGYHSGLLEIAEEESNRADILFHCFKTVSG